MSIYLEVQQGNVVLMCCNRNLHGMLEHFGLSLTLFQQATPKTVT